MMPEFALVIVNYNSWDKLYRCIEALGKQTFNKFDIVVIDNGGEKDINKNDFSKYDNVLILRNSSNKGFAAANNQVIKALECYKWVALLNPDAFPEPDWMERLVKAVIKNPDCSIFASRLLMEANKKLLDGDGDTYHLSGLVWREGHGKCMDKADDEPRETFSACAAAVLYHREAFMSVGGFDEHYFCYVEDVDLGFRLRLKSHLCLLIPDAIVHHIGSASTGGQQSNFAIYHGHRNIVWTFIKNMPGVLFWILLPLHIVMNFVIIVWFLIHGQGGVIIKSKLDAIKGIKKTWKKRQLVQKERSVSIYEVWRMLDKRMIPPRILKNHD